jgi:hypothetical protein
LKFVDLNLPSYSAQMVETSGSRSRWAFSARKTTRLTRHI